MKTRTLFAALLAIGLAPGCDVRTIPPRGDGGGGGVDGGGVDGGGVDSGGGPRFDAGSFDPFDPANACGSSAIPTQRVPGSLLIVFDRSGSMDSEISGGRTKWDLATESINRALGAASDELSAGLLLFSSDGSCGVNGTPNVPVTPLPTSRSMIANALAGSGPSGSTPAFAGLLAGYDYLDTLTTPGQRGVVLVSDGGETCDFDRRDEVMARVQREHDEKNRLTFAVGMDYADNNMSTIAYNGGTPRNDTCMPMCTSGSCFDSADCGGAPCVIFFEGEPGFCSCENDSHCVDPQTCEPPPFMFPCGMYPPGPGRDACEAGNANRCVGDADCCHYNAAASDFQAEFEAALDEIARRLLDSCVFDVPRGANPDEFDPTQVNVGVTFDGEERTVLRRGEDPALDSWDYTSTDHTSIIIQGPICERLLNNSATVEIVLGCPTILI